MELNCRVRNSQESIKDILKRQVLNLKRYDPTDEYSLSSMEECGYGDWLRFDDVINLFK